MKQLKKQTVFLGVVEEQNKSQLHIFTHWWYSGSYVCGQMENNDENNTDESGSNETEL